MTLGSLGMSEGERDRLLAGSLDTSFEGEGGRGGGFMERRLARAVSVGLIVRAPSPLILPDFLLSREEGESALVDLGLMVARVVGAW